MMQIWSSLAKLSGNCSLRDVKMSQLSLCLIRLTENLYLKPGSDSLLPTSKEHYGIEEHSLHII